MKLHWINFELTLQANMLNDVNVYGQHLLSLRDNPDLPRLYVQV